MLRHLLRCEEGGALRERRLAPWRRTCFVTRSFRRGWQCRPGIRRTRRRILRRGRAVCRSNASSCSIVDWRRRGAIDLRFRRRLSLGVRHRHRAGRKGEALEDRGLAHVVPATRSDERLADGVRRFVNAEIAREVVLLRGGDLRVVRGVGDARRHLGEHELNLRLDGGPVLHDADDVVADLARRPHLIPTPALAALFVQSVYLKALLLHERGHALVDDVAGVQPPGLLAVVERGELGAEVPLSALAAVEREGFKIRAHAAGLTWPRQLPLPWRRWNDQAVMVEVLMHVGATVACRNRVCILQQHRLAAPLERLLLELEAQALLLLRLALQALLLEALGFLGYPFVQPLYNLADLQEARREVADNASRSQELLRRHHGRRLHRQHQERLDEEGLEDEDLQRFALDVIIARIVIAREVLHERGLLHVQHAVHLLFALVRDAPGDLVEDCLHLLSEVGGGLLLPGLDGVKHFHLFRRHLLCDVLFVLFGLLLLVLVEGVLELGAARHHGEQLVEEPRGQLAAVRLLLPRLLPIALALILRLVVASPLPSPLVVVGALKLLIAAGREDLVVRFLRLLRNAYVELPRLGNLVLRELLLDLLAQPERHLVALAQRMELHG
mmetsp:Transcript_15338/g.46119  ORF Transcript_15338/g.46119 Transcript_15338/m.46119 type:complete len:614 (-) Transcript_15338:385-2226(-)